MNLEFSSTFRKVKYSYIYIEIKEKPQKRNETVHLNETGEDFKIRITDKVCIKSCNHIE